MPCRTNRCSTIHQTISGFSPQKFAGGNKQGDAVFAIYLAPWFQSRMVTTWETYNLKCKAS